MEKGGRKVALGNRKPKVDMVCPFCPRRRSSHLYKTANGLRRHIWSWHVLDSRKKLWITGSLKGEEATFLRVYTAPFSRYRDYPVNGKKHIDALVKAYLEDEKNPSLRVIQAEGLEKLLEYGEG